MVGSLRILLLALMPTAYMENLLKYNIVVADDDSDDHFFLEEAMRASNIQSNLISVYNGSELLDLLHTRGSYATAPSIKPDLVLLDLNMPVLDGFTALKQIKKNSHLKDIPVYIFTTSRRDADRKACEQLGADDFFSKPSEFGLLQQMVKDIMSKAFKSA